MAKAKHLSVSLLAALVSILPAWAQDAETTPPQPAVPPITDNQLKGLFTPQPQYPTPQSVINPDVIPHSLRQQMLPEPPEMVLPPALTPAVPETPALTPPVPPQAQEAEKEEALEEEKEEQRESKTHSSKSGNALPMTPLRLALGQLKMGHYEASLAIIDKHLLANPNDAQAHYVRAVALACSHQYPNALLEYRRVLTLAQDPRLVELAHAGIKKIER